MKRATLVLAALALLLGGVGQARAGEITYPSSFHFDAIGGEAPASFPQFDPSQFHGATLTGVTYHLSGFGGIAILYDNDTGQTLSGDVQSSFFYSGSLVSFPSFGTTPATFLPGGGRATGGFGFNQLDDLVPSQSVFVGTGTIVDNFSPVFFGGGIDAPRGVIFLGLLGDSSSVNGQADLTYYYSSPEPSTLTLLGFGTVALIGYGWRRRKLAA
jgi:hypothetical protein